MFLTMRPATAAAQIKERAQAENARHVIRVLATGKKEIMMGGDGGVLYVLLALAKSVLGRYS